MGDGRRVVTHHSPLTTHHPSRSRSRSRPRTHAPRPMTTAARPLSPPSRSAAAARRLAFLRHQGALVALAVACVFGFARYAAFLTPENLLNVLRQNSMLALVAL